MKPLISADEIQTAVSELAERIETEYRGKPLTIVGVLTGSLMLLADLVRRIDLPLRDPAETTRQVPIGRE